MDDVTSKNFSQEIIDFSQEKKNNEKNDTRCTNISNINSCDLEIETLKHEISFLKEKLSSNESEFQISFKKISQLEKENFELNNELSNIRSKVCSLKINNEQLNEQLHSSTHQLKAAQLSFIQSKTNFFSQQCDLENQKKAFQLIDSEYCKMQNDYQNLQKQNEKLIITIHKQDMLLSLQETKFNKLLQEKQNLQKDQETQKEMLSLQNSFLDENKRKIGSTDIFLKSAFINSEFPSELCSLLSDSIKDSMPLNLKMQVALTCIGKFYNNILIKNQECYNQLLSKCTTYKKGFQNILNVIEFENNPNDFDNDIKSVTSKIIDYIQKIKKEKEEHSKTKTKFENLQENVQTIFKKVNANSFESTLERIDLLSEYIQKLNIQLKASKIKYKKMMKSNKRIANAYQELSRKNSYLQKIINKQKEKETEIIKNDEEIQNLKDQIKQQQDNFEVSLTSALDKQSTDFDQIKESFLNEKKNLLKVIQKKEEEIKKLHQTNGKMKEAIEGFRNTITQLENEKIAAEKEKKTINEQNDEALNNYNEKIENERNQMGELYKNAINQLKEKNSEQRKLLSNVSLALEKAEQKNQSLLYQLKLLKSESYNWNTKFQSLNDQMQRNKSLNESKMKVMKISMESRYKVEMNNLMVYYEKDKNNFIFQLSMLLKDHIVPERPIKDDEIMNAVKNAVDSLKALQDEDEKIRNFLNLSHDISLSDALREKLMIPNQNSL